jgi:L-cysteine/cystine lyase
VPRRGYEAAAAQLRHELEQGRLGRPHFDRILATAGQLRTRLAGALGCEPLEVGLTRSTTDGVATVMSAVSIGRGDEVLTTDVEHPGVLAPLELARRRHGFEVRFVPFDEIAGEVGPSTKLVVCSHVSWADGRMIDAEALRATGVSVLYDGAQGLGAVPLDMRELGCDFYAASGQKWLCGPDGSGSLYVRAEVAATLDPPWPSYASLAEPSRASELIAHEGARRFDMGVAPGPPTAWALASLELLQEAGLDWVCSRAADGAGRLAGMLAERGLDVAPRARTTLVSWRSETAEEDVARLASLGVMVRFLPGLDLVRASVGAWTSDEDLERLVSAVVA